MDFRSSCIKVQFVITIRLFKLYYSVCFSTLSIKRKLYCKMLYFSKILKWELNINATKLWSISMKKLHVGICIALVCCAFYRSFSLRSFKDRGKLLENNSYRTYHRYKFQISCQCNLLPHIRQPDWKCYNYYWCCSKSISYFRQHLHKDELKNSYYKSSTLKKSKPLKKIYINLNVNLWRYLPYNFFSTSKVIEMLID